MTRVFSSRWISRDQLLTDHESDLDSDDEIQEYMTKWTSLSLHEYTDVRIPMIVDLISDNQLHVNLELINYSNICVLTFYTNTPHPCQNLISKDTNSSETTPIRMSWH